MQNGFHYVETEEYASACFALISQLRPHLSSNQEFMERWKRQVRAGYKLLSLCDHGKIVALAGFRVQDNLIQGPHLFVDDLVTDEEERGSGYGGRMIEKLKQEATLLGFDRLALNAALTNSLGHRFYFRHGLTLGAVRFETMLK